tara:strand:+ start:198 stop:362 length:165 start_codon:yes stop_codon:yes gene_type:complete
VNQAHIRAALAAIHHHRLGFKRAQEREHVSRALAARLPLELAWTRIVKGNRREA